MKIFILIISLISFTFANYIQKGNYKIDYTYINMPTSPENGNLRYSVILRRDFISKVVDLKNAKIIDSNSAVGLDSVIDALRGENKNLDIYKKHNSYKIVPKDNPNNIIIVNSIEKINYNYNLDITKEREKELNRNYNSWLRMGIKSYTITIYDSRFKRLYPEGVILKIKNDKIIEAKDVRSQNNISIDKKLYPTLKKLFGIAKWGIKDAIIDYDINYFYPSIIKLKNGITIYSYNLKPL